MLFLLERTIHCDRWSWWLSVPDHKKKTARAVFFMAFVLLAKESLHEVEDRTDGLLSCRARRVLDGHLCEVE